MPLIFISFLRISLSGGIVIKTRIYNLVCGLVYLPSDASGSDKSDSDGTFWTLRIPPSSGSSFNSIGGPPSKHCKRKAKRKNQLSIWIRPSECKSGNIIEPHSVSVQWSEHNYICYIIISSIRSLYLAAFLFFIHCAVHTAHRAPTNWTARMKGNAHSNEAYLHSLTSPFFLSPFQLCWTARSASVFMSQSNRSSTCKAFRWIKIDMSSSSSRLAHRSLDWPSYRFDLFLPTN